MLFLNQEHQKNKNVFLVDKDTELTYEDVFKLGDTLYSNKKKELVLILCDKDIETVVAYIGAIRNNKVPLLIDVSYKKDLIKNFINNYLPKYIFCSSKILLDNGDYFVQKKINSGILYKSCLTSSYHINEKLSLLIPTSGSTGDPKCVRLSSNNVDSCTNSICEYLEFDENRISISLLPINYSYGLSVLHNCIYKRAKYVLSKLTILEKELWDEIEKNKVTDFSGVPFMMKLLKRINLDFNKIKSLKYITQAGGYMTENDSSYLFKKFTAHDKRYYSMYGQTEASPRISYLAPEYADSKSGTVGVPISCGEVYIKETGKNIGTGELCYKGPNVALGYASNYKDLQLDDEFQGTLLTGDIAEIDSDGFIKILGRNKRIIKINGMSVNLDKIEKDLSQQWTSVTVGKDDKLVILSESEDLESIKSFFTKKYNFNKTNIKIIHIEKIPLNTSGKNDYKLLTEKYV